MSWTRADPDGISMNASEQGHREEYARPKSASITNARQHDYPRRREPSSSRWLSSWSKDEHAAEPHGVASLESRMSDLVVDTSHFRSPCHRTSTAAAAGPHPPESIADTMYAFEPSAGQSTASDGISQGRTLLPSDSGESPGQSPGQRQRGRRPPLSLNTASSSHSMSFMSPLEGPQITPAGMGRGSRGNGWMETDLSSRTASAAPWLSSLDEELTSLDDEVHTTRAQKEQYFLDHQHQEGHHEPRPNAARGPRRAQTLGPAAQEWEFARYVPGESLPAHRPSRHLPATRSWTAGEDGARSTGQRSTGQRSASQRSATTATSTAAQARVQREGETGDGSSEALPRLRIPRPPRGTSPTPSTFAGSDIFSTAGNSPRTAESVDSVEGTGSSSGRYYDRRSHVATLNALRQAARHEERSATAQMGSFSRQQPHPSHQQNQRRSHGPRYAHDVPMPVGSYPFPAGVPVCSYPPMGYMVMHQDGTMTPMMWPMATASGGHPPMMYGGGGGGGAGGVWQWMPAQAPPMYATPSSGPVAHHPHPTAAPPSRPPPPQAAPRRGRNPVTAEDMAAVGPAREWDRVREQASKAGNFAYVGPATKTKVCRYVLARNNNHFGKTCTYIHPCRSLLVQGRCAHGKRCTDDHLCRDHVWTGTCPRGGVEGGCGLLHLTQESDVQQLRDMFREWVDVDGRPKSDDEMRAIIATMEQQMSSSSSSSPARRGPCPYWFHDTQAGCKAGPECPFEHTGQLQLPNRPRPCEKDVELAHTAWQRRCGRTGEAVPRLLEGEVESESARSGGSLKDPFTGQADPGAAAAARTTTGLAAALPAGLPFTGDGLEASGGSVAAASGGGGGGGGGGMSSSGMEGDGPLASPPYAAESQVWMWAQAAWEQQFSGTGLPQ